MCSNTSVFRAILKKIWNIQGSHEVKIFLWKAWNNILPTKDNLFHKGIVFDPKVSHLRFGEGSFGPYSLVLFFF
jgi:hypothetical protein